MGGIFEAALPENPHFFGKGLTVLMGRTHRAIRHRLARFVRKTKAYSRSLGHGATLLNQDHPENLHNFINAFLPFFG